MAKFSTTIRMGASRWTVDINASAAPMTFDLRKMTRDERRQFHAAFMAGIRKVIAYKPSQSARVQ
jgi:hypothetical protein